jgi:hypothetical protein
MVKANRGRIPCSVSHWEAPHEIHIGEWKVAPPAIVLCHVRSAYRSKLPARTWDASRLLRSRLLLGSLSLRDPASRKPRQSIMIRRSLRSAPIDEQNENPTELDEQSTDPAVGDESTQSVKRTLL